VRRALEAIYRKHKQGLFTLALAVTGRADLAEDAVQEAFLHLWNSSRSARAGDLVGYVFAAVRNAAIDQLRKRPFAAEAPASIFDGSAVGPEAAADRAEQFRLACRAVEALPAEQREAVVLRIYAGLTFRQAAEALGEPLATVASRYRRALETIRAQLREIP